MILSQVAAGLQGREGPVEQDEARALQEQALRLRESAAMFQAIKTGREILKATPTADHEKVISQLEATVQLPGLGDMLRATAKPGVDADGVIKFLDENPTLIPGMADLIRNGVIDPDSAIAVVTDLMKRRAASLVSKDLCHNR